MTTPSKTTTQSFGRITTIGSYPPLVNEIKKPPDLLAEENGGSDFFYTGYLSLL